MTKRIAINGFGRIGRSVFRILAERDDLEVVAINDLFNAESLAYLLQYDTVMGPFKRTVSCTSDSLSVDGKTVSLSAVRNPAELPWAANDIDVVVEATGIFRSREQLQQHLSAGAKRVLLTVPPKDDIDAMVVMGVNNDKLSAETLMVSNASCTTNCLAPLAHALNQAFVIERGIMTTVHAYTNDQRLEDFQHADFRRSRAAAQNIIPTTTGAAKAVGKVIPELAGKLDGMAARVPIPTGSVVDLVVQLGKKASTAEINAAVKEMADGPMKGILQYSATPLVSSDIIGNPHSSIFDASMTQSLGDGYARVLSWYDNEWGYSNRCVDVIKRLTDFL